jgi:hypothetical protein
MKSEGSLPCSKVSDTCPYSEPDYPVRALLYFFFKNQFNNYRLIFAYVLQVVSFLQVSPPKPCTHFSSNTFAT